MTFLVRELLPEMFGNLCTSSDPDILLASNIFHDPLERHEATWLSDATAMESDSHHFRRALTSFFV